jgi:hypothetical protein
MAAPGEQGHHLISQNVLRDHPLFKALAAADQNWDPAILDLPDKATAADQARVALFADAAHQGRHRAAYDTAIRNYLAVIEREYALDHGDGTYSISSNAIGDVERRLWRHSERSAVRVSCRGAGKA